MTNDELEQIMNFIIERHERLGERLDQIAAETTRQMELMSQQQELMSQQQELTTILLDAQVALTESVQRLVAKDAAQDERLAEHNERIARFERSYVAIAGLLQKHDERIADNAVQSMKHDVNIAAHDAQNMKHDENIAALTDRLDRLAQTVERYVAARGTNGDTGNMPS